MTCLEVMMDGVVEYDKYHWFVVGSWTPPYHDFGLVLVLISLSIMGNSAVLFSPVDFIKKPILWLKMLHRFVKRLINFVLINLISFEFRYKVKMTNCPNFALDILCNKISDEDRLKYPIPADCKFGLGGEPILSSTVHRFMKQWGHHKFIPAWGMAESTLAVTSCRDANFRVVTCDRRQLEHGHVVVVNKDNKDSGDSNGDDEADTMDCVDIVSQGDLNRGVKVAVVNPKTRKECAPNEIGELYVSHGCVSPGYWKNPEKTKEVFNLSFTKADGSESEASFLRTGDLGFIRKNEVYICGRIKDTIIIRGRNLYPHDFESRVSVMHKGIRPGCCIAMGISNYQGVEREQLIIVTEIRRTHEKEDLDSMGEMIRGNIAQDFGISPAHIIFIKERTCPKTSSGKVRRRACRLRFRDGKLQIVKICSFAKKTKK